MEFPVLLELPLQTIPRRIITQFLRAPHPTAVMIKDLSFDYVIYESNDRPREWQKVNLVVRGQHLCIVASHMYATYIHTRPTLIPSRREIWFAFNVDSGERNVTNILIQRHKTLANHRFRRERGLPWRMEMRRP